VRLAPLEEQGVLADQVRQRDEIVSREFSAAMDEMRRPGTSSQTEQGHRTRDEW
jgi:hypothetical protein